MEKGLFITFEGIDGCGKSSMQRMANDWLISMGYRTIMTFEPGGSDLGQSFRRMLLDSSYGTVDPNTETLLFMADRSRHVDSVILPAIRQGKIVLCDRYTDSTMAYQGGGRGLDKQRLAELNDFAVGGVYPDITFVLTLPVEQAVGRQSSKKDRMEQEDLAFFRRVAAEYEAIASACPQRVRLIDASVDIEGVFAQIKQHINALLADAEKIGEGGR